jgi:hypothetical protein
MQAATDCLSTALSTTCHPREELGQSAGEHILPSISNYFLIINHSNLFAYFCDYCLISLYLEMLLDKEATDQKL